MTCNADTVVSMPIGSDEPVTVSQFDLVDEVRRRLAAVADPDKAPLMQAYMKSRMPFRGVTAVPLRKVCRAVFDEHRLVDRNEWKSVVLALWDDARFREERYAAVELTGHRYYKGYQDVPSLDLYRHLVVTGAWWDFVDPIASNRIGPILRTDPDVVAPMMRSWAVDADLWVRRTALLCQLWSRNGTDLDLLTCVIEQNLAGSLHGGEFFIRKAIGWALREHAKTDPAWVTGFVADHAPSLSGLSRREALKNIGETSST
jgi:3-methyladenine DNA glycosylase AlkD